MQYLENGAQRLNREQERLKKKRLKEKMEILGATFCFPISVVHRKFEKTYLMVKKFIFRTAFTVFGFYVGSSCENY